MTKIHSTNKMSTQKHKIDTLTEKARSQLAQFAVEVPMELRHKSGTGTITTNNSTDDEIVLQLNLNEGQLINKVNTMSIVFNPDDVIDSHSQFHDQVNTSATSFEVNKNRDHTFSFGTGRAMIAEEYLETIESIYNLDLRGDDLDRVLGNSESDNYPIKVADPEAETYMLIAPRILER